MHNQKPFENPNKVWQFLPRSGDGFKFTKRIYVLICT